MERKGEMNPQKKLSMAGTNRMDAHLENRMQTSEKKMWKMAEDNP